MQIWNYGQGIQAIDSGYHRPMLDAIHLIVDGGEAAVVDTGTTVSVPRILEALDRLGVAPQAVRYVLLTHVHLDHAAGAGALMAQLGEARLVVHPRGARHMADPRRLWAASAEVYGADFVRSAYGEPVPVQPGRIIEAGDGLTLDLGRRQLVCLDTPGHARHHLAFHDSASGHVFAGDVFGLSYRELDQDGRAFIIPTCSPSQFDPPQAHRSVNRILALAPEAVYLTHFSQVRGIPRLAALLHQMLERYAALAERCCEPGPGRLEALRQGMQALVLEEARAEGLRHGDERVLDVLGMDLDLNAQGLAAYLDAQAAAAAKALKELTEGKGSGEAGSRPAPARPAGG